MGSELYVQPKDSRLKLEVEVANDNALHWKDGLSKANIRSAELRTQLYRSRDLLRAVKLLLDTGDYGCRDQITQHNVDELQKLIDKELG